MSIVLDRFQKQPRIDVMPTPMMDSKAYYKDIGMTDKELAVFNTFSLDSCLAAYTLATFADISIRGITDVEHYTSNADSKVKLIGVSQDNFKHTYRGLKGIFDKVDKPRDLVIDTFNASELDLTEFNLQITDLSCAWSFVSKTDSKVTIRDEFKVKTNFILQQFMSGTPDMNIGMLYDLWKIWASTKYHSKATAVTHKLPDDAKGSRIFESKFTTTDNASLSLHESDFKSFMANLKSRISGNYSMIGMRVGTDVKRVCLTTLTPDEWIWAKRIISSAHKHWINIHTTSQRRFVVSSEDEKTLKANGIEYEVYINGGCR